MRRRGGSLGLPVFHGLDRGPPWRPRNEYPRQGQTNQRGPTAGVGIVSARGRGGMAGRRGSGTASGPADRLGLRHGQRRAASRSALFLCASDATTWRAASSAAKSSRAISLTSTPTPTDEAGTARHPSLAGALPTVASVAGTIWGRRTPRRNCCYRTFASGCAPVLHRHLCVPPAGGPPGLYVALGAPADGSLGRELNPRIRRDALEVVSEDAVGAASHFEVRLRRSLIVDLNEHLVKRVGTASAPRFQTSRRAEMMC